MINFGSFVKPRQKFAKKKIWKPEFINLIDCVTVGPVSLKRRVESSVGGSYKKTEISKKC